MNLFCARIENRAHSIYNRPRVRLHEKWLAAQKSYQSALNLRRFFLLLRRSIKIVTVSRFALSISSAYDDFPEYHLAEAKARLTGIGIFNFSVFRRTSISAENEFRLASRHRLNDSIVMFGTRLNCFSHKALGRESRVKLFKRHSLNIQPRSERISRIWVPHSNWKPFKACEETCQSPFRCGCN